MSINNILHVFIYYYIVQKIIFFLLSVNWLCPALIYKLEFEYIFPKSSSFLGENIKIYGKIAV